MLTEKKKHTLVRLVSIHIYIYRIRSDHLIYYVHETTKWIEEYLCVNIYTAIISDVALHWPMPLQKPAEQKMDTESLECRHYRQSFRIA